ncbi:MAG: FimV/HubP family polar landmark protein, partial [bacterium]
MLVAMVRENKDAFDAGNMNRLRTGAVLRIPDASTAGGIAQADAVREVRTQVADFN